MFSELGEELKKAREEAGIPVEKVASKLKIDKKFVMFIEEGHFTFLPDIYVKAFVREIASMVGLNENEVMKKYEEARGIVKEESEVEESADGDYNDEETDEEGKKKVKLLVDDTGTQSDFDLKNAATFFMKYKVPIYIFAGLIVAFIAVYFIFLNDTRQEIVTEKPIEDVIQEHRDRYSDSENETSDVYTTAGDSLVLSFNAVDTVWMLVISDQIDTSEFYLYPYTKVSVKAAQIFKVILGNSGGIRMALNNQPLQFSQQAGRRRILTINKEGILSVE